MRPSDNSDGQEQCFFEYPSCASFNPQVQIPIVNDGDTSSCTFQSIVDWGDGSSQTYTFPGGADGATDITLTHAYTQAGSYTIGLQDSVLSGSCTFNSDSLTFTLLSPLTSAEQGGAQDPSEKPVNCSTTMPVNCATGVFWHTFTDFSVPGRGIALGLTRTYSSSDAGTDGPFGFGWSFSYGMSLAVAPSGDVTITQEDGATVTFSPDGSGGFIAPPRVEATLVSNPSGGYTFTRDNGETSYGFTAAGQLTSKSDLNGYVTAFAYNASGQLASVTDPAGRTLAFTYSGVHVASVTDPMGRVWKYGYDSSGNLVTATDPLGRVWKYSYDGTHRLLTMTNPRGGTTSNTYNASGQVTAQVDPDGGKTTWSYSGDPATLAGGSTTMTDPDGNVTEYGYSDLEMVSVTAGAGTASAATTTYTYDPSTLGIVSETNPDGDTTTNTYDANGNVLTTTDSLGNATTYTYNSLNEVLAKTDPLGNTTSYSYDADGNLLSVTDPLGDTTTYAYADTAHPGDITSVTDPDGHVTSYAYDSDGGVASVSVSPSAGVTDTTEYVHDKDGERTCAASPDAAAAGVTCPAPGTAAKASTTTTVYDADGEVTSVTDPDGHVTKYSYDADGDRSSVTSPAGQVTSYAYNGDGKQVRVTQPGGTVQLTGYDADGNVTSQVNAAGGVTKYAYDPLGHVVSTTDPMGHGALYEYDLAGNRITRTDAEGQVTSYAYDADGRLTGITYSDGKTPAVSYAYNADGHRTTMADGTGTTSYAYNADSHLTSVTDGAGATVSYGYDPAGLLASITYPNGQQVTRGYDSAGELTSVSDWLGNTTTFGYDHDGNLTSEAYPSGVSALPGYDKADQLVSVTAKKGSSTLASFGYARNALGEVSADTEAGAVPGTQDYSYTQLSQLASDSAGSYGYDLAGDLTAQPGGETQAFNTDSQLTSTTAPAPVKAPATATAVVSASQVAKGSSVTSPALTTKASGELIVAFISTDGPAGKSQQVTSVSGGGLTWRLVARGDGQQGTAEAWQAFAAKPLSNVKATATLRYKGYDAAITVAAFSGARAAVGSHATASKSSGAPSVSVKTTGTDSLVWAVGEDPSHATGRKPAAGQTVVYQKLDTKGNATFWTQRTGTVATAGTGVKAADTTPTADKWNLAAVEILAAIPTATTSYTYNKDGDRTTAGSVSLGYNQAGELIGYGTTATYAYNGDGLRMSKTDGGTATAFAWDQSGSNPLLIAAGSTSYIYGPGAQPIEQVTGTTPSYLLADQSGSTRLITSPTGAVTGTYTYGPYGTVTKHTGATTALQYDGQYTDAESGYQYLQARYYDPATGQFLTADPDVTVTLAPYGYAADNPLNVNDPSGQCPMCISMAIGGIAGGVAGAIGGCTGTASSASCFAAITGGVFAGVCAGSGVGILEAGACGAGGASLSSLIKTASGERQCLGTVLAGDAFGFLGGAAGAAAFPINSGWFPPTNLSNLWSPGTYAGLVYQGGLLGGLIGEIPDIYDNFSDFFNYVGQQYSNAFSSLFQGNPYAPQPFNPSSVPPPGPPF